MFVLDCGIGRWRWSRRLRPQRATRRHWARPWTASPGRENLRSGFDRLSMDVVREVRLGQMSFQSEVMS